MFQCKQRKQRKGGWTDLTGLVIVAGIMVGVILFASYVLQIDAVQKIIGVVGLDVDIDVKTIDKGTEVNTLLTVNKDIRYSEIIGLMSIDGYEPKLGSTLEKLEIALSIEDREIGNFNKDYAQYVDYPLPGMKKGRLGLS